MAENDMEALAAKALASLKLVDCSDAEIASEATKCITVLLTALRSTTAEPVAYLYRNDEGSIELILDPNGEYARRLIENGWTETPLYARHPTDSAAKDAEIAAYREALEKIAGNGDATGCNPQLMCDTALKALNPARHS